MGAAALVWLAYEGWRLLAQPPPLGGMDLRHRHREVQLWFQGEPVYRILKSAVYPPASHALLWPFTGWLGFGGARWLWAATTVAATGWLVRLLVKASTAPTRLLRLFVAAMVLSAYAVGATIGNGQLALHVLPCTIAAVLILRTTPPRWGPDLLSASLFLFALVKPSLVAPFFWIVLFMPRRARPALLVIGGYLALTLFAATVQSDGLVKLFSDWMRASRFALSHGNLRYSHSSVHSWFHALGIQTWHPVASVLLLLACGAWIYRHRHVEPWLLLSMAALVSRFYTYHGWYDDVLLLIPAATLFRIASDANRADPTRYGAGSILCVLVPVTVAPGGLYLLPSPWREVFVALQTAVWLVVLVFLARIAGRPPSARAATGPPVRRSARSPDAAVEASRERAQVSRA